MIIFNSVKPSKVYSFGTRKTCIIKRRQSQQIIKKKTPKFTFFLHLINSRIKYETRAQIIFLTNIFICSMKIYYRKEQILNE